jgi:hypothetical protein
MRSYDTRVRYSYAPVSVCKWRSAGYSYTQRLALVVRHNYRIYVHLSIVCTYECAVCAPSMMNVCSLQVEAVAVEMEDGPAGALRRTAAAAEVACPALPGYAALQPLRPAHQHAHVRSVASALREHGELRWNNPPNKTEENQNHWNDHSVLPRSQVQCEKCLLPSKFGRHP